MAKVTGPLYSMSASGKIADAMVFFGWKGKAVVRQWLKPSNPMTQNQGDQRIFMGGTGRAVGKIYPNTGHATVGAFAQQLIDLGLVPSGQTKQSFLVQYIVNNYLSSAVNYSAYLAEMIALATAYSAFSDGAGDLNITEFDLDYAAVEPYNKALGLYLIAKAAIALGFTGTPYSLALPSWVAASVDSMISDFTNS